MPAVQIAQHWIDELKSLQPEITTIDMNAVVDAALQQYTYRQRQEKIARERQWYETHYAEISKTYLGQYIGIHNGRILDHDADGTTLSKRLRQEYGRIAIAIIQVQNSAEPPIVQIRSPKISTTL